MRRQTTGWEETLAKDTSDRVLLSKIHKELLKLGHTNMNHPILKMGERPEHTFHQRRYTSVTGEMHL